jgi:DNA-binding winged helix-turn-helix (wHTH) protein
MLQISPGASPEGRHDRNVVPGLAVRHSARPGLRFGRCEVRPASREVLVNGRQRDIQPRPFDLLVYLIEHRERVLSIDELLDAIWGRQVVQPSSLTVAINRIRSVLGNDGGEIIRTHHRVGYRFVAALEEDVVVVDLSQEEAKAA